MARPGFATVVGILMLLPIILTFKDSEQISICFFVPKIGIRCPISTFTFLSEILSKCLFMVLFVLLRSMCLHPGVHVGAHLEVHLEGHLRESQKRLSLIHI